VVAINSLLGPNRDWLMPATLRRCAGSASVKRLGFAIASDPAGGHPDTRKIQRKPVAA
jgi:hypothetical protein